MQNTLDMAIAQARQNQDLCFISFKAEAINQFSRA